MPNVHVLDTNARAGDARLAAADAGGDFDVLFFKSGGNIGSLADLQPEIRHWRSR